MKYFLFIFILHLFYLNAEGQLLKSVIDPETENVGFIDEKGLLIVPYIYEQHYKCSYKFKDSLCLVRRNGRYGYINQKGKEIVNCIYTYLGPLSDGVIASVIKDSIPICSYLNAQGNVILRIQGRFPYDFHNGLARFLFQGKYGYINKTGQIVIPNIYQTATDFEDGTARVIFEDKEIRVINYKGEILKTSKIPKLIK